MTVSGADSDEDGELSEAELTALTVAQLKAIAADMGLTLTATKKAEIIAEILAAQAAAEENANPDPDAPNPDAPDPDAPDPDAPNPEAPGT